MYLSNNIAEITLIGTGGYGESSVLHLGNQNWIVVDSCVNPLTNKSLPLEYLEEFNIDLNNVKLIVCTHWHDDHIKGLSQLVEKCPNANISWAHVSDLKKFLRFVSLDYKKIDLKIPNSSTIEFNKCLELLKSRKMLPIYAISDRLLFKIPELECEILSLSPSDYTIGEFDKEISTLITDFGKQSERVIIRTPNSKCVVLYVKIGEHRALLGSDMEVVKNNEETGWLSIIKKSKVIDKKSSLYKISHHGSSNSHDERIWISLLEKNPIASLTPYNKNKKLPDPDVVKEICNRFSNKFYMTSPLLNDKPKKRDRGVEKMLDKWNYKLREVKYNKGIIRCNVDINNSSDEWSVKLFGNAFHINEILD